MRQIPALIRAIPPRADAIGEPLDTLVGRTFRQRFALTARQSAFFGRERGAGRQRPEPAGNDRVCLLKALKQTICLSSGAGDIK